MKQLRISISIGSVLALFGIAGVSKTDISAAINATPTVAILRNTALNMEVWPGDFNGDGITDLASSASPTTAGGVVEIALGRGDGTFNAPIKTGQPGRILAVGDFNGDGKLDVVASSSDSSFAVFVLAGNGDGTLGALHLVGYFTDLTNALAADLDGDGTLDVVALTDTGTSYVYPGNGDFTFDTPATLTTGPEPLDAAIADLNGDGRKDIVVANHGTTSISIFLNQGSLTFTAADMPLDLVSNDVVARDLNGDGKMDLVVAVSESHFSAGPEFHTQGFAYVLFGNGDGTFAQPAKYRTAPGAWQIVLGDFTRDGIVDIATANRSSVYIDDCSISLKTWDSVSILPGNGTGTFGPASSFSLGNQSNITDARYKNTVISLNTSDIDRDGHMDLIASWGAILINKAADPNWAPSVTAKSTQPVEGDHSVVLTAPASDSDQDMLTYSWFDSGGSPIPPVPNYCFTPGTLGVHTFTVTVDDQHGHTSSSSVTVDFGSGSGTPPTINITAPTAGEVVPAATPYQIRWTATAGSTPIDHFDVEFSSDDGAHYGFVPGCTNLPATTTSCQWADPDPPTETARIFILATAAPGPSGSATTNRFSIRTGSGGGGGLPSAWQQTDIGAVGAAGSATYSNGVFTIKGSGADIWGTADEFHFAYTSGDFTVSSSEPSWWEITTRVDSVQNVQPWTKAGVMIRESLAAGARHASLFVTPGKGIAFQRRTTTGGTSVSTSGPAITAPVWLKLGVAGPTITAYYRKNVTDPWTVVAHDVFDAGSPSTEFNQVYTGLAVTSHQDGTLATAALSNVAVHDDPQLTSVDVGTSGGSTTYDYVIASMTAKGADIWGTSDQFRFAFEAFSGDTGSITTRVTSVQNVNAWTKAGVMFREGATATTAATNAKYVFVMATPGKGITMQYRIATGGSAASAGTIFDTAPGWVRIAKDHDTYTGYWSKDAVTWKLFGSVTVPIDPTRTQVGLALTSHSTSTAATATFDDIAVKQP